MKKIIVTTLFVVVGVSLAQASPVVKNLDICVKAYSDREAAPAMAKCQAMASSLNQINQQDVQFTNASCLMNAQGVGKGFASANCGVYDVVLKTTLQVEVDN